jgi:MbtH protein
MSQGERQDTATYRVVVDHARQCSIRPIERAIPRGWREAGKQGSITECLAYIEQAWERLRAPAEAGPIGEGGPRARGSAICGPSAAERATAAARSRAASTPTFT